jgi:hypothetical protein
MVYRAGVRTRGKVPQRSQIMFQEDLGVEIPHSEAAHCPQDTYSPSLQHLQAAEATASACSCWGRVSVAVAADAECSCWCYGLAAAHLSAGRSRNLCAPILLIAPDFRSSMMLLPQGRLDRCR